MRTRFAPTANLEAKVAGMRTVRSAITEICRHIEREAKRRAPVRTGNLRRSIGYVVVDEVGTNQPVGYVGATAFYAAFVEFGTRRNRPQPFLRPALLSARRLRIR